MRRVVLLLILLALMGMGTRYALIRRQRAREARLPIVETATVERGEVTISVSGTGVVEPLTTVDVKSETPGRIVELLVDVGQEVKAGQVIARIDPTEPQAQFEQAQADVEAALARVRQAETSLSLQQRLTPVQVEEAQQQLASAKARLEQARKALELEQAQVAASIRQAEEALAAAQARERQAHHQAETQPHLTQTAIAQAQAAYEAAVEELRQLKEATHPQARAQAEAAYQQALGNVEQAQAGVRQAQAALEQAQAALRSAEENLKAQEEALRQLKEATHPQARAAAQAAFDQAQANLVNAEKNLKRQLELLSKGFVSQAQVDTAQAQYEVAKAQWNSAKERLNTLQQEQDAELKAAQARVADAQTRVADAKARIASAEAQLLEAQSRVRTAEAELASAKQRLDTLQAQQEAEVRNAEARVAQTKAALESAQANAVQNRLRQEELQAAQAAVRQAEANLEAARANAVQLEIRRAEVRTAEAAVKQAEAALESAKANQLQERVRASDIVNARAQLQRAQAQLENARKQLRETIIYAPRSGIVLQKYVEEGTMVVSGSRGLASGTAGSIVQLGDMSRVFVDCQVDETDIGKVWEGQSVDITVDAFPEQIFEGKVVRIDPRTTTEQNVTYVHVKVEFDMPDPRLKPGMTATCEFIVERREDVLVVPTEALREAEDGGSMVEVLVDRKPPGEDPKVRSIPMREGKRIVTRWILPRKVEVGLEGSEYVEILSGLQGGEVVVTSIFEPQAQQGPSLRGMMRSMGGGGRP